ncbi:GP46 family protein (modular protein) [uncultured Alphaproteobacteria bacterium]|uniref:GP46 family protein (Modular protein) n=1 Tax=uncultured Alphaproteobacteria bacterium TaxID=91750 RepID=A0A212KJX3_9PROT|nr:GP46 family protein (modular protein) [uncultured Alphaproteobacteria bacterium]
MSDAVLAFDPDTLTADLVLMGGDLETASTLETAVILSLFSDARADAADELPAGETWRRGWALESVSSASETDRFGSKLWLGGRRKKTEETRLWVIETARAALQWMIDDGIAGAVEISAEWVDTRTGAGLLRLTVTIVKPDGTTESYVYQWAWDAQAERMSDAV